MSATGYTPIQLYYSSTATNTPLAANLAAGELAINTADGKLFYKDSSNVVQVIGTKGGIGSSSTTQVLYNSSGLVVGSANLTFSGTTLTTNTLNLTNALGVGYGGTGLTSGTSGGVLYYSATGTLASSAALAASALVIGGGAGTAPSTTTTGTGVVTALGVNTGSAGAFVVNGGALGTPSSGTVTNLTGTASININGTVGATTASTGAFTTVSASGVITSTVTTGTAPFTVSSTTQVANLNVATAGSSTTATNLAAGTVGAVPYQTGAGATSFLTGNTTTTPQFVTSTGTGTVAQAPVLTTSTGTGSVVLATSPSLTTPTLGAASATTINKVTLTAPATGSTLTIVDGKTLTANNSITLSGTDATVMTFPSTSGTVTTNAGTATLTNKWLQPRVLASTANSATPTLNTDNYDMMVITGQSVAITSFSTNLTGTPVNGQRLVISITGTGAIAITWGASFEASTVALPSTTVTTARLDVGFIWNVATSKWRCVASA